MKNNLLKYFVSLLLLVMAGKSFAQPTIELFSGMNNQIQLQKNGYIYKNGMHYVVWSNGIHGGSYIPSQVFDGFVKLSTSPDGLVWTTQNILPATTYGTWGHVLAVDNAGKLHIAYTKGTQLGYYGGNQDGVMVYANNISGTWTEVSPNLGNGTSLPYNFHEARELTFGADGKLRLYFTNSTGWYAYGAPLQMRVWEAGINDWSAPVTISALDDAPNGADSQRNVYLFSKIVAGKMQVYTLDAYRADCAGCTLIPYSNIRIFEENPTTYAHTLIGTIPNFRHYTESLNGLFNFTVGSNGLDMKLNTQPFFTLPVAEVVHYPYMWIDQNSEFIVTNSGNQSRSFNRVTGAVVNQISNQFMIPSNGFQLIADNTSNPRRLYRFVNPSITAPSALSFTASGGNQNAPIVTTTCTGGWTAVSNQTWLTFTPASGVNGTTNMTITATANSGAVRTGTITITGCNGAVVKVITVTQNAGNIIGSTPVTEILYNSPAPAYIVGTSNAIIYNNKITVAAGMFPSTKPGYPDPSIWSTQVKLIAEGGLVPNGSIYNGYVQMYDFPIRNHPTNTKIGFAYQTSTFGYAFNLPYSVWNGTAVESTETAFTNANWGWSPRFQYNNAGNPRITSFAHSGYYLLYHNKDGGSWVNNSVTGFGTHYSPRASIMHNDSYYFVARQNTGTPNLVLFKEDASWTPETITTSVSDVSDLKINGTDIYALYTDNAQVKLAKRPLAGGAWTIETVVAQDSVYHRATVFFASDNTPYVSFVKGQVTNAELKVYKKTAGAWGLVFSNPCLQFHSSYWSQGQNPTMIQKDGKVYVLYSDNYNVYLTNLNGVPTGLAVTPTSLAFGNVTTGSSTTKTFTVTNVGTSPVVVQSVNYPTGYSGTFAGGTIAGGASLTVTVTFAPTTSGTFNGVVRMNVDGVCGGYIVNLTGFVPQNATPCNNDKIFFSSPSTSSSISTIWRMNPDGTGLTALFNDAFHRNALSVSDDGTKLAYAKRNVSGCAPSGNYWICTSNIDGTGEIQHYALPSFGSFIVGNIDFSPDKTKLVFNTFECNLRDGDIFSLALATNMVTQLTNNTNYLKQDVSFSHDGSKISFFELSTPWFAYPVPGYIMNSDGTNKTIFTPLGGGNYHQIRYSPNGTKISFTHFPNLGNQINLYTCNPDGTSVQMIPSTSGVAQALFNPNNDKIAFTQGAQLKIITPVGAPVSTINTSTNTAFNDINWVCVSCAPPTLTNNISTTYATIQTNIAIVASPTGSTFTANGAPITTLNPNVLGVGMHTIVQSFTDANGCSNTLSKTITVIQVPTIANSTGNTCWTNTNVTIDANATLTGSGNLAGAIVNFGTGYNSTEDRLVYPTVLFGVTGTFDAPTGVLKLTGTATVAQYQQILRTIQYQNISASPAYSTIKPINFTLGDALPFSGTQHFYKFIPAPSITWTDAKVQAETLSYFGLQGYLVTITSAQENAFAFNSIAQNGWIGASDDIAYNGTYTPNGEGQWYWVTGPEKGTRFWQGVFGSGSVIGTNYANWGVGQPDNGGSTEHYGQFWLNAGFGKWNDLPNFIDASLISGYYVEFGGMPNESTLQTTSTKNVELATKLDFTLVAQICVDAPAITLAGLPTGGTFKVNGSSATAINPATLGVGTHTVLYEKAGCTLPATKTIEVKPLPSLSFVSLQASYCVSASAVTLQATPSGGTFKINGVSATQFNPTALGANTHTVLYEYTDGNACKNTKSQIVTVNPLPVLNFVGLNSGYCVDANAVTLSATPTGGTFTINGTSATAFNPTALGVATHTVIYTYTDANTCTNTKTQIVTVNPLPTLSFVGLQASYCVSASAFGLQASPAGGSFKINGISATQFNPSTLGIATHTVVYTYTDANGCTNSKTQTVVINTLPTLAFVGLNNAYCVSVGAITLQASPTGGTFTVDGNAGTVFNPSLLGAGNHTVIYTYTDANTCTNTKTQIVTVNPLPVLNFVGLNNGYCVDANVVTLSATPTGGTFTINGTSATTFNPTALGVATHTVIYTYTDANTCTNSKTQTVIVNPLPTLSFVGLQASYCVSASAFGLQASPAGGSFKINGISATQFNPSTLGVATHTVIYTYTDANGCKNSKTQTVVINALPTLAFVGLQNAYCIDATGVVLQASPVGGTFTINGTSATSFNPTALGAGNHTVVYTYTDANTCTNTQTQIVAVNPLPTLAFYNVPDRYCPQAIAWTLQAIPAGGQFTVNGLPATALDPTQYTIGTNITVTYTYTDANTCTNSISKVIAIIPPDFYDDVVIDTTVCLAPNKLYTLEALTVADVAKLTADGWNVTYIWSNGANPTSRTIFIPATHGTTQEISVIAKDQTNCYQRKTTFKVKFECKPNFHVPTAFTPNNNNLNDGLETFGKDISNLKFMLYNRWGEVIYTSYDLKQKWDGTVGGKPAPAGVYVWQASYKRNDNGENKTAQGKIMLIQ